MATEYDNFVVICGQGNSSFLKIIRRWQFVHFLKAFDLDGKEGGFEARTPVFVGQIHGGYCGCAIGIVSVAAFSHCGHGQG